MGRPFFDGAKPRCFAHRGGAHLWPENTMIAFESAIELGITYLEMDLHLTRDGEIVVCHDPVVDRTTDGVGPIADRTLAQVKQLDAGYRHVAREGGAPWRGKGIRIPTLDEVFDLSPAIRVNVEIKQRGTELVRALTRFIERRDVAHRILVAAAHHPSIQHFRSVSGGHIATGASAREALAFWAAVRAGRADRRRWPFDALQVPVTHRIGPGVELCVVEARFVRAAHGLGIEVHPWVIDRPEEMRRLLDLGVDGLMTDRPDYLLQVAAGGAPGVAG